jgi:hypothetical protein
MKSSHVRDRPESASGTNASGEQWFRATARLVLLVLRRHARASEHQYTVPPRFGSALNRTDGGYWIARFRGQ